MSRTRKSQAAHYLTLLITGAVLCGNREATVTIFGRGTAGEQLGIHAGRPL